MFKTNASITGLLYGIVYTYFALWYTCPFETGIRSRGIIEDMERLQKT